MREEEHAWSNNSPIYIRPTDTTPTVQPLHLPSSPTLFLSSPSSSPPPISCSFVIRVEDSRSSHGCYPGLRKNVSRRAPRPGDDPDEPLMSGFHHRRRFAMWEMCCGSTADGEAPPPAPVVRVCEKGSQRTRRRWMDIRRFGFAAGMSPEDDEQDRKAGRKRRKLDSSSSSSSAAAAAASPPSPKEVEEQAPTAADPSMSSAASGSEATAAAANRSPKYGLTSVCGMRRDMEDAVSIQLFFSREQPRAPQDLHFFGVFDGHGCSHVRYLCICTHALHSHAKLYL